MYNIFIDGKEGTTGLKIFERFKNRDDIKILEIDENLRKDITKRKEMINKSDITFLCLPDSAAIEAVSLVENDNVKIIDASTAHRTNPLWTYGFPELSDNLRTDISFSKRVAVPGCHASGAIALIYPLIKEKLVDNDYHFVITSITGYSGGGKKMIADYENSERNSELNSPRMYGLNLCHKHLPEIKYMCGLKFNPIFTPVVADYFSGMLVTVPLYSGYFNCKTTLNDIKNFYKEYYKNQKLIKVAEDNYGMLASNTLSGANDMQILINGNDDQILLSARFDNLGKGASGAAVQCMNIMLGLEETTSLV